MAQISINNDRFIGFNLGEEEYAFPLLAIKEVIGIPETTPIPQSPNYFLGLMNLRGSVIPVIDLRVKLGIKGKNNNETAVIICDLQESSVGVVVDSINSVLSPEKEDLSPPPQFQGSKAGEFVTNVYRKGSRLVLMLDMWRVLSQDDKRVLQGSQPKAQGSTADKNQKSAA